MDVLKDDFFDDYADNRNSHTAPNGANGNGSNGNANPLPRGTNGRPFPDSDYNKNGKLRTVRGRVLKKLLKYEFKAYLTPMLIMLAGLFAIAFALCLLGCFITPEEWNFATEDNGRMVAWIIAVFVFVWVSIAAVFFPLGFGTKRYHQQFFTSQGYLTLSIPASPEEHILAKRIAIFIAMLVSSIAMIIALIIAFLPVINLILGVSSPDEINPDSTIMAVNGWDVLYTILEMLLSPLFLAAVCGAFACWRHRGLKTWMIILLGVGAYMFSTVLTVLFSSILVTMPLEAWEFLLQFGKWILFLLKCLGLYLLFRYETQTLRKKINLK